ncbi:complement factor H-related protein 1-like [Cheilinus undulatus]|uniref:complement factor H-related protein 1-like n=1 Tax=Cheilinus undulatus TaxID=241271 RepID=UPI001BD33B99|nr:complement factor H-related protein 1-like [Cheilinus undulatus]
MRTRYFGFLLLIGLPAALYAQSAHWPCRAPSLVGGYFVPEKQIYPHGSEITYSCESGRKPAVEGWWATSTCQNGEWSHEPRCIDERACVPLEIPNGKYNKRRTGWYGESSTIRVTCEDGYELKNWSATATCLNGAWSSVPICEISINACSTPPKVPHAVIVGQRFQEVYPADSEVQYECEDGYTVEGAVSKKTIICMAGNWTEGPTCSKQTTPDTGHSGPEEADSSGGHSTSPGSGTRTGSGDGVDRPGTGHGGSTGQGGDRQPVGGGGGHGSGQGGHATGGTAGGHITPTGSGAGPASGGSSSTSGLDDRNNRPAFISVDQCGVAPVIQNSVLVEEDRMYLKYQCNAFYTLEGSDTVACYSDQTWSELPQCKEAFCVLDLSLYHENGFQLTEKQFVKEGETKSFSCIWQDWEKRFTCTNGRLTFSRCCHRYDHYYGRCQWRS